MDLKNTSEQLTAQEVELVNGFQMEELEERMEMSAPTKEGWTIVEIDF